MTSRSVDYPTPDPSEAERLQRLGLAVVDTEAEAVQALRTRINGDFARACRLMLDCQNRVVVTGMGKSGHIGGKIAATLASTGTPAFFVHPGEASHGDLGMITAGDVVLALSNSGETGEILTILPLIRRMGAPLVAMTGNAGSTLGREATVHLDVSVAKEACPLDLAPTASSTAALVMGDALAIALLEARGFTAEDFALSHPGGSLGRRLLLRITDIMHQGNEIPQVSCEAPLRDALLEMTRKGLGMTAVVDADRQLCGIFTDGDLRRVLDRNEDLHQLRIDQVMTRHCRTISADLLAVDAVRTMEQEQINSLLVVDGEGALVGALNMHDLLQAGVV